MFRWAKLDSQVGRRVLSLRLAQASPAGLGLVGCSLPLMLSLVQTGAACAAPHCGRGLSVASEPLLCCGAARHWVLLAASLLLLGFVPVCALA